MEGSVDRVPTLVGSVGQGHFTPRDMCLTHDGRTKVLLRSGVIWRYTRQREVAHLSVEKQNEYIHVYGSYSINTFDATVYRKQAIWYIMRQLWLVMWEPNIGANMSPCKEWEVLVSFVFWSHAGDASKQQMYYWLKRLSLIRLSQSYKYNNLQARGTNNDVICYTIR